MITVTGSPCSYLYGFCELLLLLGLILHLCIWNQLRHLERSFNSPMLQSINGFNWFCWNVSNPRPESFSIILFVHTPFSSAFKTFDKGNNISNNLINSRMSRFSFRYSAATGGRPFLLCLASCKQILSAFFLIASPSRNRILVVLQSHCCWKWIDRCGQLILNVQSTFYFMLMPYFTYICWSWEHNVSCEWIMVRSWISILLKVLFTKQVNIYYL